MKETVLYSSLVEEEKKLLSALYSVRNLMTIYDSKIVRNNFIEHSINEDIEKFQQNYKKNWSDDVKIIYALKRLRKANINEIVQFISTLDDSYIKKTATNFVQKICDSLLKQGVIGSIKIDKRNEYYIF